MAAAQGTPAQSVPLYGRADAVGRFGSVGGRGLPGGVLLSAGAPFIGRRMGGADVRDAGDGGNAGAPGALLLQKPAHLLDLTGL
ncbi:hypothetical protein DB35_26535 [Streptomyces abyssalis]|uniref:hypothetical protein n=1 Tax=Streptomyces abyssalis TaxID=933944 RepID=UPI00085C3A16|nr:hypothetical protein [Streptomyces abyssalis]OEU87092.1 hypothetical protein DB35_26535 [Streptomyces abyssalis]